MGRPPAQVALAWLSGQPGVTAPIVGATRPEQLADHLAALDLHLSEEQRRRLDEAGALPPTLLTPQIRRAIFGGAGVRNWDEQQTGG